MASFSPVSAPAACCDGDKLIVPQGAALPVNICIKCGAPANGKPLKKMLGWHTPWLYILIVSPIIYVIVALIVRKQMRLAIPLCDEHAARRKRMILIGWGLAVAGIASVIILANVSSDAAGIGVLLLFVLLFGGLIVGVIGARIITPAYIDASYGSFNGACRAFLDQLPRAVSAATIPPGSFPPAGNFPPGNFSPPSGTPPPPRIG
ncbi:MAG TPA: hypothetical protein VN176_00550 [Verrucomicrobiae bacterium]|jgi:hypothetical protein|nr:hypothetical protein [Verrucomicrobiae bacterium]